MSWLIERLKERKKDRGLMANLRCFLVENKKNRAWPAMSRLGIDINDEVSGVIAGLFATHPENVQSGNFGDTCKRIESRRGDIRGEDMKLTPTEKRFQYLLAAEKGDELHQRVTRLVLMAKSHDIPINYDQLLTDLRWWDDSKKTQWASHFWTTSEAQVSEEES